MTDAPDEMKLNYYLKINALFQKADWLFLRNVTIFEKFTSFKKLSFPTNFVNNGHFHLRLVSATEKVFRFVHIRLRNPIAISLSRFNAF